MTHAGRLMGVLVLAALVSLACDRRRGSCNRRNIDRTCNEVLSYDVTFSAEAACKQANADWSTGTCDRTDAVGACETAVDRTWYFADGKVTTLGGVAAACARYPGSKTVDPSGNVSLVAPTPTVDAGSALSEQAITRTLDEVAGGHGSEVEKIAKDLDGKPWKDASAELTKRYKSPVVEADGTRVWADPEQYGMICTMIFGTNEKGVARLVSKTTTDPGPTKDDADFSRCLRGKIHARGM